MRLASLFAGLSALLATGLAPAFAAGPAATTIPDRALATAETLRAQGLKDDLAWTLTEDLTTSVRPRLPMSIAWMRDGVPVRIAS